MPQITELITKFSFEGSTGPLKDYNRSLGKSIGVLVGMASALGVVAVGLSKWATGISQSLQPLINLNALTGVSVDKIQELSFIAEQSSSSTEALYSSIGGLSAKIGEAAQKGSDDFSRLGISVRSANGQVKSTDTVLAEVGNRFRQLGLSMSEQQGFAEALGIDSSLLSMLNRTGAEMASLRKEAQFLGILTDDQVKSAQDYNDAIAAMGFGMDAVKRFIAVGLAPELEAMADDFKDLLAANKGWIIDGIKKTSKAISILIDGLIRLAPFIAAVGAAFLLAKVYTLGFAGVMALVFSPVILIAAAIGSVLLVLDDLIVAFGGGKSVIRDFFLSFGFDIKPVLIAIVKDFKAMITIISNLGAEIFDSWIKIFSGFGDIFSGNFIDGFDKIGEGFSDMIDGWGKFFKSTFGVIFDWAKKAIMDILPDWVVKLIGADSSGSSSAPGTSQALQPGGGVRNNTQSNTVEQIVNMEIRTSDPEKAGSAAADGLQRQLENAQNQTRGRGGR